MFFQTIQSHPLCFLQIHWAPSHSAHSSHAVPLRGAQCCAPIAADPTNLRPQPPSQATEGGCILGVNGLVFPGKITGKLPWSSWENLAGFRWRCSLKSTHWLCQLGRKVTSLWGSRWINCHDMDMYKSEWLKVYVHIHDCMYTYVISIIQYLCMSSIRHSSWDLMFVHNMYIICTYIYICIYCIYIYMAIAKATPVSLQSWCQMVLMLHVHKCLATDFCTNLVPSNCRCKCWHGSSWQLLQPLRITLIFLWVSWSFQHI